MTRRPSRVPGAGERALFDPGSLRAVVPSPARVPAAAKARVRRARLEESGRTIDRMRRVAAELGRAFGLRLAFVEAEQDGVSAHYGVCYRDGRIRIRLRHAVTGRLLKESSLVDTLCHELAHLRHFDHSPEFRELYFRILGEARRLGHYRPGAEWRRGQRPLFDSGEDDGKGSEGGSPGLDS